jgi:hypothetical protein
MKKIVFIICLCFFGFLRNSQADTIYAEVNADTATIWHKEYHTSCSSSFMMNFQLTDNHIILFEIDTSGGSYCLCYFDLNTQIGGLSAGIYTVDVYEVYWPDYPYSNYTDTTFLGNTTFEIEGNPPSIPTLLSNKTSDCYQNVGIKEFNSPDSEIAMMSVNPNPVNGNAEIVINIIKPDKYEIKLLDETGKFVEVIIKMNLDKGIHHISWDSSCIASGLYFLQLSGTKAISSQKVIVQ